MLSKSQLKYIQSLHHKKFREEHRAFLVEGNKLLEEAVTYAADNIQHIYVAESWMDLNRPLLDKLNVLPEIISDVDMGKLSSLHTPPGVLLVMKEPSAEIKAFKGLTLVLDGLQDPGNLGTIIRTADWFGVSHIVCGPGTVDAYNPKVIQSSMGSIFRVQIVYQDILAVLDAHPDIPVVVSHLQGSDISETHLPETAFMVIGNESKGVSDEISERATSKVKIPGFGKAESLNASIATAILLYAWKC